MFGNLVSERDTFRFDNEEYIESRYANKTFWISEIISIWNASESYKAGKRAQRLAEEGGALSQSASYANAADAEALGALNASAIMGAASNNATMSRELGYENAQAITDATLHNLQMYKMQSDEQIRQHDRQMKWNAGEIRAIVSSSGVMVNGGSPQAFLESQITAGLQDRRFMMERDMYTMIGTAEDGLRQSLLTVKTANMNAQVMESNAALKAQVTIAEATAQAAAMRRQGDISAAVGVANGQAAYYGGQATAIAAIGNAAGYAGQAYSAWKSSSASASFSTYGSGSSNSYGVGTYNPSSGAGGF